MLIDEQTIPYPPSTKVIFAIANSIKYGIVKKVILSVAENRTEVEYLIDSLDDASEKVTYSIYNINRIKLDIENCGSLLSQLQSFITLNKEDK